MTNRELSHTITAQSVNEHLDELRNALVRQRNSRLEQLAELNLGDSPRSIGKSQHRGLRPVRSVALAALSDTDAALQRLARGCYGRCEQCDSPIPLERLEILPMARLCTGCQHAKEAAAWRADRRHD